MKGPERSSTTTRASDKLVLVASVSLAAIGFVVGIAIAEEDPETLVYDSVLGRTVPAGVVEALRRVEPSTEPEDPGTVGMNAGLDPNVPEAPPASSTPRIQTIDLQSDDYGGLPFPSGLLRPTTVYSRIDGDVMTALYAGASADVPTNGLLVKIDSNVSTGEDTTSIRTVPDVGRITLTEPRANKVLFATDSGDLGTISPATMEVELDRPSRP